MMKAVVLNDGVLEYKDVPRPKPSNKQVLIKLVAAGVCHTDAHIASGEIPISHKREDLILGHEAVGEIAGLGAWVDTDKFKIGDHVLVPWLAGTCGKCEHCVTGHETMCDSRVSTGVDVDGAYAEFMVASAFRTVHLPPNLDPMQAAPLACAGVTAYKALKESGVRPGQWVAIMGGGGGLGHLALQFAKAMAMNVICIDIDIQKGDKASFCEKLGVCPSNIFDGADEQLETQVEQLVQGGVHASVVLAPSPSAYKQAIAITRRGGSVMCVALPKNDVVLNFQDIVTKELQLKGSLVGDRQDLAEALQFAVDKKVICHVTERNLKDTPKAFEELAKNKVKGRVVLKMTPGWTSQVG